MSTSYLTKHPRLLEALLHVFFLFFITAGAETAFTEASSIAYKVYYDFKKYSVRGGANHNFHQGNNNENLEQYMPPTLGDVNRGVQSYGQHYAVQKPKPITQAIRAYLVRLHRTSPALYYGTISSILVFLASQIPSRQLSTLLDNHFINSRRNLSKGRYHTVLTAALNHSTFMHLALNLYGFHMFGKSVLPMLSRNGMPFSFFCILAGVFSNLFFAMVHPLGSCIGLSGVALSLLALDAKLFPNKVIGFVVRFIPIQCPAQYALIGLLVWSSFMTLTMMNDGGRDGVAHATHLGGLLWGILVYELIARGVWNKFFIKSWRIMKKKLKLTR
mmetsp:Transcript_26352/g.39924  ORF Transcript_26352/g.39924 Transcript_26352/m.39924 type:complete len:330 (-) Transcript_26352:353-1342(-)